MNHFIADYLGNIIPVTFTLLSEGETITVGNGEPEFTLTIHKDIPKTDLLTSTSLALGEAYMRGDIEIDRDLYEVLNKIMGHMDQFTTNRNKLSKLMFPSNSKKNQEKEVTSHYDIGNDFYELWLDPTMSYSCGYFKENTDTLYQAQVNKVNHILEKLQLMEGMTLLDVGCGWGFLLKTAVKEYGVKGYGITLSKEQYKKCKEEIQKEGLEDRLQVKLMDYRDLHKSAMKFDRIVSVGMLEHVGRGNYELFLASMKSVLRPNGLFLLHSISALQEFPGDAWIKKYIFPGGTVPSLREIINIMGDKHLYTLDVESLRRHYNRTLLCWRENFLLHKDEVIKMHGDTFARMWELYLSACAATFYNGIIDVHQILMSNGVNNELPLTRVV